MPEYSGNSLEYRNWPSETTLMKGSALFFKPAFADVGCLSPRTKPKLSFRPSGCGLPQPEAEESAFYSVRRKSLYEEFDAAKLCRVRWQHWGDSGERTWRSWR